MIGGLSKIRLSWDVLIAFLAFVSCILVSWQLVFEPGSGYEVWSVIYVIDLIFLIDIGLNLVTSYRDKGVEVTAPRKTARRYARTMLPCDGIANFPWEILLLFVGNEAWLGVPLLLWLRLPRFLRVIRLFAIFRAWESLSWMNPGILRIIRFGVAVALATHLVACSWFFTAAAQEFPPGNWCLHRSAICE